MNTRFQIRKGLPSPEEVMALQSEKTSVSHLEEKSAKRAKEGKQVKTYTSANETPFQ